MTSHKGQYINVRGYRRDNEKWTIQRNWQHRRIKTKQKHNIIFVGTTMLKQTQIT